MSTSTVKTLIDGLVSTTMTSVGDNLTTVLGAFAILVGIAFGIHLFRKYVFRKKV